MLFSLLGLSGIAQSPYKSKSFQFLSFEKIPTWVGVTTNWQATPEVHLYNPENYKGHADYISIGLRTGITFQQFKEQVRDPAHRRYVPFFLFDLRDLDVKLDGTKYDWALRLEDYRFLDNQEQMQQTCLRMLRTISKYIESQSGKPSKGLIVLATNTKATPNASVAPFLNESGYPNLTRSQLLTAAGGKKVEVLNAGTGIGYLRLVKDEKDFHPSPRDILIYPYLPERVPPVQGIITLQAQTPLSHINLLARNRGTINLYATELNYLPGAKNLIGQLVKIECSEKKIAIAPISEKEAKKHWAATKMKVEIPQPHDSIKRIVGLSAINEYQTTRYIGSKAANYARIHKAFKRVVPEGFAIPFSHYFRTIEQSGADTLIEELVQKKMEPEERNAQLKKIRTAILSASLDSTLIRDMKMLIKLAFKKKRIRLRSSTNCEDLPEFNGAGLYKSKGFNYEDGDQVLEKKILKVYASLWTPIAYEEREYFFIDHRKVGMAILINRAFRDEYANGVALTMVENGKVAIYINSQFGENAVTNPKNGQIPESIFYPSAASDEYEVRTQSNIHPVFDQPEMESRLQMLKEAIEQMHQMFTEGLPEEQKDQYGIDIEFKLMVEEGKIRLYIKQARLIRNVLLSK